MPGWRILKTGAFSTASRRPTGRSLICCAYFEVYDRADQQEVRDKVVGQVLALDRELSPIVPALLSLFDVPVEDPQWQSLNPRQRRERTLEAVRFLLLRESQVQPLCIVFEDLHWIDSETQAFLDGLILSLPAARVLLLVNYRQEYRHAWAGKSNYTQLGVLPLPPENADELLRLMLGDDDHLAPLKLLLIEQTRGNPFFLEECVRMKVEDGVLVGSGEAMACQALRNLPGARHRRGGSGRAHRPPRAWRQNLLQAASAIGENVPVVLLQTVAEMSENDLGDALDRLRAAEFVYDTSLLQEPYHVFKHALTCRVVYNSLPRTSSASSMPASWRPSSASIPSG